MKKHYYLLLIVLCSFLNIKMILGQVGYSEAVNEKIKQFENSFDLYHFVIEGESLPTLTDRMKYYNVPGVSIAVIQNYQIEWAKGYGWADKKEQKPVTTQSIFQVGSVSKSINALGIMKLVQDKKIELNENINNYLISWKLPYEGKYESKKVSTANLLSHTAGLSIHGFPGYVEGETFPTVLQMLDGISPAKNLPVRIVSEPGKKFEYSGGGTLISQLLLCDITHSDYSTWMKNNILEQLGMSNSFFVTSPLKEIQSLVARGYDESGDEMKVKYYNSPCAPGGLCGTPTDLAKFIIEIQLSLQGKSNKILSKKTMKQMLTPYIDKSSALGFFIENKNGTKYFQHSGANAGYRCKYYGSIENGNGVVVMINSSNGAIIDEIINNIARVYNWDNFYIPKNNKVKTNIINLDEATINKYTGAYRNGYEIIKIVKNDNILWYQGFEGGGENAWRINFTSKNDFFNRESKAEKSFYFDENGNVKGFHKVVDGKSVGDYVKIAPTHLSDSLFRKYIGKYKFWGTTSEIIKRDSVLWLHVADGYELPLNFISSTDFFVLSEEVYKTIFSFEFNSNGEVRGITEKNSEVEIKAERIK